MKKITILLILLFSISYGLFAQVDSTQSALNLLDEISSKEANNISLLPSKMIFTQQIFWGNNGLMRKLNRFELTPEKRQKELKIRRVMLVAHQTMGFVTMGAMLSQIIIGAQLYNGHSNLKSTHEVLAGVTNVTYFTTVSLALFAPPKMIPDHKGYSSIKVHKILAIIHISGMIATDILGDLIESHPNLKPYHMAAAITTFAAFSAAMIIIKF